MLNALLNLIMQNANQLLIAEVIKKLDMSAKLYAKHKVANSNETAKIQDDAHFII